MVPFQSVNKKYYIQKKIIVQMEEKLMMSLQQPQGAMGHTTCSPDTDRTGETEDIIINVTLWVFYCTFFNRHCLIHGTQLTAFHIAGIE